MSAEHKRKSACKKHYETEAVLIRRKFDKERDKKYSAFAAGKPVTFLGRKLIAHKRSNIRARIELEESLAVGESEALRALAKKILGQTHTRQEEEEVKDSAKEAICRVFEKARMKGIGEIEAVSPGDIRVQKALQECLAEREAEILQALKCQIFKRTDEGKLSAPSAEKGRIGFFPSK